MAMQVLVSRATSRGSAGRGGAGCEDDRVSARSPPRLASPRPAQQILRVRRLDYRTRQGSNAASIQARTHRISFLRGHVLFSAYLLQPESHASCQPPRLRPSRGGHDPPDIPPATRLLLLPSDAYLTYFR